VSGHDVQVLAGFIEEDGQQLLETLAENVASLVGHDFELKALPDGSDELASAFGKRRIYLFPLETQQGEAQPALMALDLKAAVHVGAALSMMGPEQVKEVFQSGEVPEILHDSIGEVANILCGAAVNAVREDGGSSIALRRAADFRALRPRAWPALLEEVWPQATWTLKAGRIVLDGEDRGGLLIAAAVAVPESEAGDEEPASDAAPAETRAGDGADAARDEPAAAARGAATSEEELPPDLEAAIAGPPGDTTLMQLHRTLESVGLAAIHSFPLRPGTTAEPSVLFVVSRSPTDLKVRLGAIDRLGPRPDLVVACSDRPTRHLVVAARAGGADDFLVLPAERARLKRLLSRLPRGESLAV
jgi:hypothetical protein